MRRGPLTWSARLAAGFAALLALGVVQLPDRVQAQESAAVPVAGAPALLVADSGAQVVLRRRTNEAGAIGIVDRR